jgi:uncharacterized membrane protein YccC
VVYVIVFAGIWSAVGALVYFVRGNLSVPQRVGLTIATSVVFGIVGWVDVSSIYHTVRPGAAVVAKGFEAAKEHAQ